MKKILTAVLALALLCGSLYALAEDNGTVTVEVNTEKLPVYAAEDPFAAAFRTGTQQDDGLPVLLLAEGKSLQVQAAAQGSTVRNRRVVLSVEDGETALVRGAIVEALALSCTPALDLTVGLCEGVIGVIPRAEATFALPDRREKDIAVISRVGTPVWFKVLGFRRQDSKTYALLSRRQAQEECCRRFLRTVRPGDILPVRVTHEEPFGAFVDIGCGVVSLLSIDCISVSRINHPRDRFSCGDALRAVVKSVDRLTGRIYMTTKELFGTWQENASLFSVGQTVTGTIRSIEDYGVFVELTPNLAGLAEYKEGVSPSERAAVYIKSINPEKMKVKLALIDSYKAPPSTQPLRFFVPDSVTHLSRWRYSPDSCERVVETIFD